MNNVLKRIMIVFIINVVFIGLSIGLFFKTEFASATKITKADHLTGQRIGVVSAYEADYILTSRNDVTLYRYDSEGDTLMALCYGQVDGIAYIKETADYFLNRTTGLKEIDGNLGQVGYCFIVTNRTDGLFEEYNEWVIKFIDSDGNREIKEKLENDFYVDGSPVYEETGTGKTIKIGFIPTYMPVSFLDTQTEVANGFEVEIIKRFANDKNYKIEWIETNEEGALMLMRNKGIDFYVGGYTDVYREEFENVDYVKMAQPHLYSDIKILVVDDWDNLSILNFMEEEDE